MARSGRRAVAAAATALLCLLPGCRGSAAPDRAREGVAEPPEGTRVRVEVRLPGDDIGAADDRADLEAIAAAIHERGAGETVSREFGMGRMVAVVEVRGAAPLAAIRAAVAEVRPGAPPRIEIEPAGAPGAR